MSHEPLKPLLKQEQPQKLTDEQDYVLPISGGPVHNGLTAVVWLLTQAETYEIIDGGTSARLLRQYLPADLGHRTGAWHEPEIWELVLGFALLARLEKRRLDPFDIAGPEVRKARDNRKLDVPRSLRAFETNVVPMVEWASLWLEVQATADQGQELIDVVSERAATYLKRNSSTWRGSVDEDRSSVNAIFGILVRMLARNASFVAQGDLLAFCDRNAEVVSRPTLIRAIRLAASNPDLIPLAEDLARRVHERLESTHEDAMSRASDFTHLARATLQVSLDEARVHFQAAVEITDAIGDDGWSRWNALRYFAKCVGSGTDDQSGRAYRLGQIAECLEPYLGDQFHHGDAVESIAYLSLGEGIATGSRWRDRRFAGIHLVVRGLTESRDLLQRRNPIGALALLPFSENFPLTDVLAQAFASDPARTASIAQVVLEFTRARPLTMNSLDEVLASAGVPVSALSGLDPSVLPPDTTGEPEPGGPSGAMRRGEAASANALSVYTDLDLSTAAGWFTAFQREAASRHESRLFDYAAGALRGAPDVIRAFGQCPAVTSWHLDKLIDALSGRPLSMGSKAALDSILGELAGRLASDFLLVRWRNLDMGRLQALSGRSTDYARFAIRALSGRRTYTAEEAYTLATRLVERLSREEALVLFDDAAALFSDISPADAHDGNHPGGMAAGVDEVTAFACLIWGALGDPSVQTRWRAAHSVHLLCSLGAGAIADRLAGLAAGDIDPTPFLDGRFDFYERHARTWLHLGVARASVDPPAQRTVARFEPLLRQSVLGDTPHVVNMALARDSLTRLRHSGLISLTTEEAAKVSALTRPIGIEVREWGEELRSVEAVAEITQPTSDPRSMERAVEAADVGDQAEREEGESCERLQFFFDFKDYWCRPLGDAFGLTADSVETLVVEVVTSEAGEAPNRLREVDIRHKLGLYAEGSYVYKGEWPKEDDLDFYRAIHGLYAVAGTLLAHLPVTRRNYDDGPAQSTEYDDFLRQHLPSRTDGRWLADRRDAPPSDAVLGPALPVAPPAEDRPSNWSCQVTARRFRHALFPSAEHIAVWGSRHIQDYTRYETVRVHSALVTPQTAPALLRALQTAPDTWAYRIPDADDREYQSTLPDFELTGWIHSSEGVEGSDRPDPFAGRTNFPPLRPAATLRTTDRLKSDSDLRTWRDGDRPVLWSLAWDESEVGTSSQGSDGELLTADRDWLVYVLAEMDRWLVLEVEIKRRMTSSYRRLDDDGVYEQVGGVRVVPPCTKYFLLDTSGEIHEL